MADPRAGHRRSVSHGPTGTNGERPELHQALAACPPASSRTVQRHPLHDLPCAGTGKCPRRRGRTALARAAVGPCGVSVTEQGKLRPPTALPEEPTAVAAAASDPAGHPPRTGRTGNPPRVEVHRSGAGVSHSGCHFLLRVELRRHARARRCAWSIGRARRSGRRRATATSSWRCERQEGPRRSTPGLVRSGCRRCISGRRWPHGPCCGCAIRLSDSIRQGCRACLVPASDERRRTDRAVRRPRAVVTVRLGQESLEVAVLERRAASLHECVASSGRLRCRGHRPGQQGRRAIAPAEGCRIHRKLA